MSEKSKSGFAVAGLVVGIIGIVFCFIPFVNYVSFVLGALAVIFGIVALCQKKSKGMAIAALIMGIIAVVVAFKTTSAAVDAIDDAVNDLDSSISDMSGDNTEDILKNNVNVTFGTLRIEGDFIKTPKLPVTVKNISSEKKSFSIGIEALDKDGNRITTDTVYANDLGAGQSQSFDAFTTILTEDDQNKLKTATFSVYEVSMF